MHHIHIQIHQAHIPAALHAPDTHSTHTPQAILHPHHMHIIYTHAAMPYTYQTKNVLKYPP